MSAELSVTIGLLCLVGFFIYLGERLTLKAKAKDNFILMNIGWTSWCASGIFFTLLLWVLWQMSLAAVYAGVLKAVFLFFIILVGVVAGVGFFIMMILTVISLYGSIASYFFEKNKKRY